MNFDKNMASCDLDSLFDCRGNEITPRQENQDEMNCPLAMVYAVKQQFRNINEPGVGLARGTIFAELDLPFTASEGGRKC